MVGFWTPDGRQMDASAINWTLLGVLGPRFLGGDTMQAANYFGKWKWARGETKPGIM
jgi:hypothetical protein